MIVDRHDGQGSFPKKAEKIMNLAVFPFGPPLHPYIVKIGHSLDTLLPTRNSEQNY